MCRWLGVFGPTGKGFKERDQGARALTEAVTVRKSEVSLEHRFVFRMRWLEGRAKPATAHRDDFRGGEFEQALGAPRDAEAAALASPEGNVGIGRRQDEIIDAHDARVEALGKLAGRGVVASENAGAEGKGTLIGARHGFVEGQYQSPILVQWQRGHRATRALDVTLTKLE